MESMTCDYDTTMGFSATEGLGCFKGIPIHEVEITYREGAKKDILLLCDQCFEQLKKVNHSKPYKRFRYKIREIKCKSKKGCGNSHNCNIKVCRANKIRSALSTKDDF